jgi:hypothetical protein
VATLSQRLIAVLFVALTSIWLSESVADITSQTLKINTSACYELVDDSEVQPSYLDRQYLGTFLKTRFNTISPSLTLNDASGVRSEAIVNRTSTFEVLAGIPIDQNWLLFTDISLNSVEISDQPTTIGLGDTRIGGKLQVYDFRKDSFGLALLPEVILPTGRKNAFLTNDSVGAGLTFVGEKQLGRVRGAVNLGYRNFSQANYRNIDQRNQTIVGVGAFIPIGYTIALNIEANSHFLAGQTLDESNGDFYVGVRDRAFANGIISVGTGVSDLASNQGPSYRFLVGLNILPPSENTSPETQIQQIERITIIESGPRCGIKTETFRFFARPLTNEETDHIKHLPYVSTSQHSVPTLQLGEMTDLAPGNIPYVKDSQTLFAIDLTNLPARVVLVELKSADLKLKVTKVSKDKFTGTEVLCFLDSRICSGELYSTSSWKNNINEDFFEGKETPNDFFARQYLDRKLSQFGEESLYSAELTLPFVRLLENSTVPDPLDIIYHNTPVTQKLKARTMYFAVADDTYVSNNAEMILNLAVDTCAEINRPESTDQELAP